jgi:hypothetical protein
MAVLLLALLVPAAAATAVTQLPAYQRCLHDPSSCATL